MTGRGQAIRLALVGAALFALACPAEPASDESATGTDSASEESSEDTGGPGAAPAAPRLLSPADGATDLPTTSELCWEAVEDPEGVHTIGYRVWIDDVELVDGKLGDYGFDSTCTGPLDFLQEREYAWRVRAFEWIEGEPQNESADSETWRFTTAWEGGAKPVFFDDFSEDLGWSVDGDALEGAWVRGTPEQVHVEQGNEDSELAQPGACFVGESCMFTGHNPGDILGEADVDGGATVLTSPPFDPGDATSLSVSLARFFHRSDLVPTGLRLEVALLVPDEDAPEGVAVHVLEALDGGPEAEPANSWEVVTFPACGVDLRPGTRLRITASDLSSPDAEIVEAAIDQVRVEGYPDMDVCAPGLGALCDPDDPDPACGSELLCCAEGPIFQGTYRCAAAERAIGDTPPAAPGEPFSGELGCPAPDLELRDDINVYTQNIWVAPDACTLYEACVGGSGWRRILSFDTKAANVGAADLVMGIPANHLDLYTYSACHEHYHFDDYASYELLAGDELVASGHKQAYCLLDFESWAWPELTPDDADFSCVNQGISVGWSDTYQAGLDCQWIDITDVDPGEYTLHVEVNLPPPDKAHPMLVERRYDNNVLDMQVIID